MMLETFNAPTCATITVWSILTFFGQYGVIRGGVHYHQPQSAIQRRYRCSGCTWVDHCPMLFPLQLCISKIGFFREDYTCHQMRLHISATTDFPTPGHAG